MVLDHVARAICLEAAEQFDDGVQAGDSEVDYKDQAAFYSRLVVSRVDWVYTTLAGDPVSKVNIPIGYLLLFRTYSYIICSITCMRMHMVVSIQLTASMMAPSFCSRSSQQRTVV